ncbi:hypothetical protein AB0M46_33570 [Dactylosporangium sp. NPDC051485]|uniref:hypothetical protein n=1 Tax=Dactylosporangium sp. NPDC051485 TaxID=3154846 RepID=UPI0034382B90
MRIRTALVLGLLLVLGGAGCSRGSDRDDGVATANGGAKSSAGPTATLSRDPQRDQENMLKFADCMRGHGIPMEDPQMDDHAFQMSIPQGIAKEKVDAAQNACKQYLPNGGEPMKIDPQMQEKLRQFAQCMREHGVPHFPDPSEDGSVMIDGNNLGVDPQGEEFKKAEQQCQQYMPKPQGGGEGGQKTSTNGGAGA